MKKLIILLAAFAVFAAGCSNQLAENYGRGKTGIGTVRVTLGESDARTLLPSALGLYYTLSFTADGQSAVEKTLDLTTGGSAEITVALEEGTWSLAVKGYLSSADAEGESKAVVSGEKTDIVVTASGASPVKVPLTAKTESGTGTLVYDIAYPDGVISVTLAYGKIGTLPISINIDEVLSGSISLDAGWYQVGVYLAGDEKEAGKVEIAHIADGLSTNMKYDFTKADFVYDKSLVGEWTCTASDIPFTSGISNGNPAFGLGDYPSGTRIGAPATIAISADLSVSVTGDAFAIAGGLDGSVTYPFRFLFQGHLVKNSVLWESSVDESYYLTKENEYILTDVTIPEDDFATYPANSVLGYGIGRWGDEPPVIKFEFFTDGSFQLSAVPFETYPTGETGVYAVLAGTYAKKLLATAPEEPVVQAVTVPKDFTAMIHTSGNDKEFLDELGVKHLPHDFSWNNIQPTDSENWHWDDMDAWVSGADAAGYKMAGLLCYSTGWLPSNTEKRDDYVASEEIHYFVEYAKQTVKRYNGKNGHAKVDSWWLWNEPNGGFWTGTAAEFYALMKATVEGIRAQDAELGTHTVLVGGNGIDLTQTWLDGMFASGAMATVDYLGYHPYAAYAEQATVKLQDIKRWVAPYGYDQKIWITEYGYATPGGAEGEWPSYIVMAQNEWPDTVIKSFVLFASEGVKTLFWYHMRDSGDIESSSALPGGLDIKNYLSRTGILFSNNERKPGYYSFALAAKNIPGKTYSAFNKAGSTIPNDVKVHYFTGKNEATGKAEKVLVLWNDNASVSRTVTLNLDSKWKKWDVVTGAEESLGNKTYTLASRNIRDDLGGSLVFFTWEE